ncbi:MAG: (Fe-S)-binding protein [Synergistaceae bacterium]|nr:(Fe-S)-binding protein [Synergistaceae bacterium]
MENGNIYGKPASEKMSALKDVIGNLPQRADTLLFVGDAAAFRSPETALAVMGLLKKAGANYTVLPDEPSSGAEIADLLGYTEDVRQRAFGTAKALSDTGASVIVTLDPKDAEIFMQHYPKWGAAFSERVETATSCIAALVRSGKLKIRPVQNRKNVTYQDPCRLARDLNEEAPARELIRATGMNLQEMFLHGKLTKCCGGEILREYSPQTASLIAQDRLFDAKRTGASAMVTSCPGCTTSFRKCGDRSGELEVLDLFCLLDECS